MDLGRRIIESVPEAQRTKYGSPLKEGFNNLNLELSQITEILENAPQYFKGQYITAIGKTEWDEFKWDDTSIAEKKSIINQTDIVFTAVCFVKILPLIQFPVWLWIWVAVIAAIKIGNAVWGLICNKKLVSVSMHTVLNKTTGLLLFLFPLTLGFVTPIYSAVIVCALATVSAINEVYLQRLISPH